MKTKWIVLLPVSLLLLFFIFSFRKEEVPQKDPSVIADSLHYIDGSYAAESKGKYTGENYWGHINITVTGSQITNVSFMIRDSSLHENVDSMYGVKHYPTNPTYQQQCVEDGNGIKIYPKKLLQYQNIDDVDIISGATWSHNIFDSTTRKALKNSVIPTSNMEKNAEHAGKAIVIRPNPFQSSVAMEYHIAVRSHINLGIYDSSGRLVKQLVDAIQSAGNYIVEWNDCPSTGIYYCRLQMDDQTVCNKIIRVQ
jgi:major membrane immunogen (membrane-anchored lipoprotein)